jgi:4,5-dihydroxyphthalate decarboxylase
MKRLELSFACWDYDRMRALQHGRVRPEGIDLTMLVLPVEETFYRQLRYREFDVCEMSISSYLLTLNEPEPPFVALPVFPSRSFRHQSVYVNTRSGIEHPGDLVGKRVGTPEYQMSAGVWIRGILADEHGVPVDSVEYFTGGQEQPGRTEKIALDLPPNIRVTPIAADRTLSDLLEAGEIDAIYSASEPSCVRRSEHVRHLFADFRAAEQDYFARTGIFPIMHTVVVRREVYERHPWMARSLYRAFDESLRLAYDELFHRNALKVMMPWLQDHVAETVRVLGENWWGYGFERNRTALETVARYSFEQGLARQRWTAEEIVLAGADDGSLV